MSHHTSCWDNEGMNRSYCSNKALISGNDKHVCSSAWSDFYIKLKFSEGKNICLYNKSGCLPLLLFVLSQPHCFLIFIYKATVPKNEKQSGSFKSLSWYSIRSSKIVYSHRAWFQKQYILKHVKFSIFLRYYRTQVGYLDTGGSNLPTAKSIQKQNSGLTSLLVSPFSWLWHEV